MSYAYQSLTEEQIRLLDKYSPWGYKVKLSELIDNALAVAAGEIPAGAIGTDKLANLAVTAAKLGADAVSDASKIADGAVSLEHFDAGIAPSHIVVFAGTATTVGGSALESITVPGALATDICQATLETEGAVPVTLDAAASNTDAIDLTFSADPSNDHIVSYVLLRAAS